MSSRLILTMSAIWLALAGLVLVFTPELGLAALQLQPSSALLLLGQALGGLYFGFAMLNWMLKDGSIGGIYNRPMLVANLSHFIIVGMAVLRYLLSGSGHTSALWVVGVLYFFSAVLFGRLLLTHPNSR